MSYVPIHIHSDHSLLDGLGKVDEIAKRAKFLNLPAITLTDHGTCTGLLPFQDACKKEGIKSILGCEPYINDDRYSEDIEKRKNNKHIILLCKDKIGYKNLSYIISEANYNGYYYRARTTSDIIFKNSKGLIITTACIAGIIGKEVISENGNLFKAEKLFQQYLEVFKDDFYVELQFNELPEQHIVNEYLLKLAKKYKVKTIIGLDAHYINKKDCKTQDALVMINTNKKESEFKPFQTRSLYIKPKKIIIHEALNLWNYNIAEKEIEEALDNTLEIADKCNFEMKSEGFQFPNFCKTRQEEVTLFEDLTYKGFDKKIETGLIPKEEKSKYEKQLEYELNVIVDKGFAPYFLILEDIVRYARSIGAIIGVGRGSACGSLVSYALGITNIDPIKFNLYFERFLNPEKVEMPDIDMDFDSEHKTQIDQYIFDKYTQEKVCKLITLSSLGVKGVLRDLGRLLDNTLTKETSNLLFSLTTSLPEEIKTLEEVIKFISQESKFKSLLAEDELFELAGNLIGRYRNSGVHAAGIVITPKPVHNYMSVQKANDTFVSSLTEGTTRRDVSRMGLLKIDILALSNLLIIRDTVDLIYKIHKIDKGELLDINLKDEDMYKYIRKGKTKGTFQFESDGMIDLIKRVKPTTFDDIVAINALFRPATLASGAVDMFIENKHSDKKIEGISSYHLEIRRILERTYGVIVYQEQVIEILHKIGKFTLAESDKARKLLVKGLAGDDDLEKMQSKFIKGALENKLTENQITELWRIMREFCAYSFCAAHATAYGYIFMQTLYLKYYYYQEYMSCLLNYASKDKFPEYIKLVKDDNYKPLKPDINKSKEKIIPESDKGIRTNFSIIKGVGDKAVEELVSKQPFLKIEELFNGKLDGRKCGKKAIEAIAKAGVLDSLFKSRRGLIKFIEKFYSFKKQSEKITLLNQINQYSTILDFTEEERINLEAECYGGYIFEHPFDKYAKDIEANNLENKNSIIYTPSTFKNKITGLIACRVSELSAIRSTKNGGRMRFVTLDDQSNSIKLILFDKQIKEYEKYLQVNNVVLIKYKYNQFYKSFNLNTDNYSKNLITFLKDDLN